jgi:CheY-like chemotaxis protein
MSDSAMNKIGYASKSVLVIDPVESVRIAIAAMLFELGFEKVIQASQVSQAEHYLSEGSFDVIMSEHLPSEIEGIHLLQKIRQNPATANLPFIIVSANIVQAQVLQAVQSGVSEFIVKPFTIKTFKERLSRAISNPIKTATMRLNNNEDGNVKPTLESEKYNVEKAKQASILVVDDIPDNIQIITEVIKKDYSVKAATSGEKALEICLSKNPPDMLLLDIMMPVMDGLTVCEKLKSNPLTQHITVIFVTAKGQTKDIIKGLELGAVDYITKPINPQILKARVATHIKVTTATKALREQVDIMMEYAELRAEFDRVLQTDFRLPLQALSDNVQQLAMNKNSPEKIENLSNVMETSCNELVSYVDNLSVLHQIEDDSFVLNVTTVNGMEHVLESWQELESLSTPKELVLITELQSENKILAEIPLLKTVIYQVLKNAVEAAPIGSTITASQTYKESKVTISIHNLGYVSAEIKASFFEKYISRDKKGSAGLGTYKAKLMTEAQNGKIWFTSTPTLGTTLFIEFLCAS